MAEAVPPLRILVLHGFRDAGERRLKQMQGLRRKLGAVVFVALDAPFQVTTEEEAQQPAQPSPSVNEDTADMSTSTSVPSSPIAFVASAAAPAASSSAEPKPEPEAEKAEKEPRLRKWWSLSKSSIFTNDHFDTLGASLQHVRQFLETSHDGPFDGILGFSQGAVLAACLLLDEKVKPQLFPACRPRFGIFVGGFAISDAAFLERVGRATTTLTIPTLHMMGTNDTLVPPAQSRNLIVQLYGSKENANRWVTELIHPGGHYIPSTAAARTTVQTWLEKRCFLAPTSEKTMPDVDADALRITHLQEQLQIVYDRLDRSDGQLLLPNVEQNKLLATALALELKIDAALALYPSPPKSRLNMVSSVSSASSASGPTNSTSAPTVSIRVCPRNGWRPVYQHTSRASTDMNISPTTDDTACHPLTELRRVIAELEARMPPIEVYPFGHVRYAAEHAELAQLEARLARTVVHPAITPTGSHDSDRHVCNQIARLECKLTLQTRRGETNHASRPWVEMELHQWRRVQNAHCGSSL